MLTCLTGIDDMLCYDVYAHFKCRSGHYCQLMFHFCAISGPQVCAECRYPCASAWHCLPVRIKVCIYLMRLKPCPSIDQDNFTKGCLVVHLQPKTPACERCDLYSLNSVSEKHCKKVGKLFVAVTIPHSKIKSEATVIKGFVHPISQSQAHTM